MTEQRKLTIPEDYKTGYLGPAVVETLDKPRETFAVSEVAWFDHDEDGPVMALFTLSEVLEYPLGSKNDVTVDRSSGTITFNSYGKAYTVRAFQDSDGSWASTLRVPVPAEALEGMYMRETIMAFSPGDPGDGESLIALLDESAQDVQELVYTSDAGMFSRNNSAWFRVPPEHTEFDGMTIVEVSPDFIETFDKAEKSGKPLSREDVERPAKEKTIKAAGEFVCPPATQDLALNLENRQNAIDDIGYGPMNPEEPNEEFWQKKAEKWSVTIEEAKTSRCGNCAAFIQTSEMKECIASGLAASAGWDTIEAADLGYCEALDFKCASARTCDAWISGGPITDDSRKGESQ